MTTKNIIEDSSAPTSEEQIKQESLISIDALPEDIRNDLQDILSGKSLPPLYSDVIAKKIFNADIHPDRLNLLLRGIAKDPTIDVQSSAGNESIRQSIHSKGMISDIPSWLRDGRLSDLEIQKIRQDFIFTRVELYASDMLLLQYSVEPGQAKSARNYTNVSEVLVVVLMVESPKAFRIFDAQSEQYIHRFTTMKADTGLTYPSKAKIIYVQLDKCLDQFREDFNAETEDQKPDLLQILLAMIADINDERVTQKAKDERILQDIRMEAQQMAQDREVQNMIIQERYDRMDWLTYGAEQKALGETIGEARGKAIGEARGIIKGEDKFAALISQLFALGRSADAEKAANDASFRAQLFKEFNMLD